MRHLFLILFCGILFQGFGQDSKCDCTKFTTGTFYMEPDAKSKDTLFIVRTSNTQTEIQGDDYEKVHRIHWLSPCKLIIFDPRSKSGTKVQRGDVIVKTIETGDNYYKVKSWTPGGKKFYFTIYVYEGTLKN